MNNTTTASSHVLPLPEKNSLRLGYVRFTDSAPLIVAKELGVFAAYGLDIELERQSTWANVRDKIAAGYLDAAHMLAPMVLTSTLGLGGIRTPLLTGLTLSCNSDAITMANELAAQIETTARDFTSLEDARSAAQRLANVIPNRPTLTLASVHPFSTHSIILRMWLRSGGINPDRDVRIIVLPPEQMVDSLSSGMIDGFCAGEPWSTRATQYGVGSAVATGYQIWNNAPEKVLGVTQNWHAQNPCTHLRLRLALMRAAEWLDHMENRRDAARMLSTKEYLDIPEIELLPALTGEMRFSRNDDPAQINCFRLFSRHSTGFPWRSDASQILHQVELQIERKLAADQKHALIQECYRPDLYRKAARELGIPSPDLDHKEMNKHNQPWTRDDGLELGADFCLG